MRTTSDLRRRRAISGILAAVILFAMLFTTGTGYFLFISNQNNQYVAALNQFETSYRAKSTENAVVNPAQSSGSTIREVVRNTGATVLNITAIILESSTGSFISYYAKGSPAKANTNPPLPIYVSPGGSSPTIDTGYLAANGVEYTVQVLTSNGNIFTGGYPFPVGQNVLLSQLSQGVGSFVLIAGSLKFFYAQKETVGTGYNVGGFYANVPPTGTAIIFTIQMQNVDPFGRSITINGKSLLTLGGNGVPGNCNNCNWYVIQGIQLNSGCSPQCPYVSPTGAYTNPVTVPYEGTMTFYFGVTSAGGTTVTSTGSAGPQGTFFLLFGTYSDGSPFAQTIPFVAAFLSGATVSTTGPLSGDQKSTITLSLSGFMSPPQAYWVNSDGTTQVVTYGTPTATQISFTIPSNTQQGKYYAVTIDDGVNAANVEVRVN